MSTIRKETIFWSHLQLALRANQLGSWAIQFMSAVGWGSWLVQPGQVQVDGGAPCRQLLQAAACTHYPFHCLANVRGRGRRLRAGEVDLSAL